MHLLFLAYSWRNLKRRQLSSILTITAMALVVFVFTSVLMLEAGLTQTLIASGSADNVLVIRQGSQTEIQSAISYHDAALVASQAPIAINKQGQPLISKETVVLITLTKKNRQQSTNITVRGSSATGLALRPQIRLTKGRLFRPGTSEIIVSQHLAENFPGLTIDATIHFARRGWNIVGHFEAANTAFNTEIWGDVHQMLQAFRRNSYSALVFKLTHPNQYHTSLKNLLSDPRLTLEFKPETTFYAEQSSTMASFIRILGIVLSTVFSLAAIIGASITMYAAVANRTAEIGTLRALGFQTQSILYTFLMEALFISTLGAIIGIALAANLQWFSVATMNWKTFSELAFQFTLNSGIVLKAFGFSLGMGLIAGLAPALRAARMNIVTALNNA